MNIYVYSDQGVDQFIKNLLNDFNSPIINSKIEIINNFSKENTNKLITQFKEDYKKNRFKNVLIIPIYSIVDFMKSIGILKVKEYEEKNILGKFNSELIPEQQPFFMFIDYEENDFSKETISIEKENVFSGFYRAKRLEFDIDLRLEMNIKREDTDKIEILKNIVLYKKKIGDDFEISVNDAKYFYQHLYGEETKKLESFFSEIFEDRDIYIFKISLILINQNSDFLDELGKYEKLEREIINVDFIYYNVRADLLNKLLSLYPSLDSRNFILKRSKKSQKFQLLKYTSYYNHFNDILYCDQSSFYPFKINIGVMGFSRSGKSTLINALMKEKRCIETQIEKEKIFISENTLKRNPLNIIEFPGFESKLGSFIKFMKVRQSISFKMIEMKNKSEIIHCLLFCIKYDEIQSEDDKSIINIFDFLFGLKKRIFFVITQSEKTVSERFQLFKGKILNIIEKVKKNYSKNEIDIILGEHIENQIIPIIAFKKRINEQLIHPFGLDDLFIAIYDYFLPKKIKYNNILLEDEDNDKEIEKLIKQFQLLTIFNSKNDLINAIKDKLNFQASNFFFKFFISNPKYLNNISKDTIYKIYDYIFDNFIIIYKEFIDKLKEDEKLKFYKLSNISRVNDNEIKKILDTPEFGQMKEGLIESKKLINDPIIYFFSDKIISLIVEQFMNLIKEKYFTYFFIQMIGIFNSAIQDFFEIGNNYKDLYKENEVKKN